jgi:hypothetical protein
VDRPRFARRFLKASLVRVPVAPKVWAHYLLSYTPRLHARIRSLRRYRPSL